MRKALLPFTYLLGSKHLFTLERLRISGGLSGGYHWGFHECCPGDADYEYAKVPWSDGTLAGPLFRTFQLYRAEIRQSLSLTVQGCVYPELRQRQPENDSEKGADGNADGGPSRGTNREDIR